MSAKFAIKRAELLKKYSAKDGQLTAGYFKDIVQAVPGKTRKGMLEIYGGVYANGNKVEPIPHDAHGKTYSDYSHQLRRVKDKVTVTTKGGEKREMTLAAFYANKTYAEEFGFKAMELGTPYITPELQKFVDDNKPKKEKKPKNCIIKLLKN